MSSSALQCVHGKDHQLLGGSDLAHDDGRVALQRFALHQILPFLPASMSLPLNDPPRHDNALDVVYREAVCLHLLMTVERHDVLARTNESLHPTEHTIEHRATSVPAS